VNFTVRHNGHAFVDSTVIEWATPITRSEADHVAELIELSLGELRELTDAFIEIRAAVMRYAARIREEERKSGGTPAATTTRRPGSRPKKSRRAVAP
jgi:hypothetical protein